MSLLWRLTGNDDSFEGSLWGIVYHCGVSGIGKLRTPEEWRFSYTPLWAQQARMQVRDRQTEPRPRGCGQGRGMSGFWR